MSNTLNSPGEWSSKEKLFFRFFAILFVLISIPLSTEFYRHLFQINYLNLQLNDLFYLTRYYPKFSTGSDWVTWFIIALLSFNGAFLWDKWYTKEVNYSRLFYWVRAIVRYRLALGLIGYAFLKIFTLQAPLPSLSNLNTNYGDFTAWKLFSLSLGVVPNYQSFLGFVELAGAILLLNRKTATIGTFIILPFIGNVAVSNIAYEGGEFFYAFYLIILALFVFAFDAIRLFQLISLEKVTLANDYQPNFSPKTKINLGLIKALFILIFIGIYGFKSYSLFQHGGYQFSSKNGIPNAEGLYVVKQFKWNNHEIPYSTTDAIRWQNVVFEKWNTLSIKSATLTSIQDAKSEEIFSNDGSRAYEYSETQGRHYYSYEVDSSKASILLQNRNEKYVNDRFNLRIQRVNDSTLVLQGVNANQDSVYAVLSKINKKYLIWEAKKAGRRSALKL
ncbi:DoxX family protein [Aquirufa nivalisilvae]|uniref:DoxX family protein n=1 Tax=Aquirufa nivalisilvae TaxID=2516557 RepID=UPI001032BB96|nr:DoxX family protein [Aquirufa nivalisilvae]TBH76251.1 DoxX family protein [Aquirufa nivalisilvae]